MEKRGGEGEGGKGGDIACMHTCIYPFTHDSDGDDDVDVDDNDDSWWSTSRMEDDDTVKLNETVNKRLR